MRARKKTWSRDKNDKKFEAQKCLSDKLGQFVCPNTKKNEMMFFADVFIFICVYMSARVSLTCVSAFVRV